MGYLDDKQGLKPMMQGIITAMSPTFPSSGQPTLKVSGQNILNSFCKEPRSETYPSSVATASLAAEKICHRLDVQFKNDSSHRQDEVRHDCLIQNNQSDILFLMGLARDEGYEIVTEEPASTGGKTVLRFVQSGEIVRTVYELRYGATLTEFQPTLSTAKQVSSVTVNSWDVAKGQKIHVEVGQGALGGAKGLGPKLMPGTTNPVADRKEVLSNHPVRDEQTARAMATARLATINQELVNGTGSVPGIPELRAGSQVYLWGLGKRFSGRYFVTGTTHNLGMSGYTTQFECRLEELVADPHEGH
jgi:phage protein D